MSKTIFSVNLEEKILIVTLVVIIFFVEKSNYVGNSMWNCEYEGILSFIINLDTLCFIMFTLTLDLTLDLTSKLQKQILVMDRLAVVFMAYQEKLAKCCFVALQCPFKIEQLTRYCSCLKLFVLLLLNLSIMVFIFIKPQTW